MTMWKSIPILSLAIFLWAPPGCAQSRAASLDNSRRVRDLLRAGTLYLSLDDALALGAGGALAGLQVKH